MSVSKMKNERTDMREKHYADEVLVGYLDGELSWLAKHKVERHLSRCWRCRTRTSNLAAEIHALTRTLSLDTISADRIHSWKLGFQARVRKYEQSRGHSQPIHNSKPIYFRVAGIAAVALIACLLFFSLRTRQPREVAHSSNFEVELHSAAERFNADPIYQQYSYEVVQTMPQRRQITGRLSVWSEPAKKRSCLRFRSDGGLLRYASWRPDEKHGFALDLSSGPFAQAVTTTAQTQVDTADLLQPPTDVEALEKMFVQWIEARQWQPLSLALDALSYRSSDGYLATVEHKPNHSGAPEIRLQLRRGAFRISIEIAFTYRRGQYGPSLQKISFTSPTSAYVLVVHTETIRILSHSEINASLFVPESSFQRSASAGSLSANHIPSEVKTAVIPSESEQSEAELEIAYVLHRTGVCMGEPVEIQHESNGRLRVFGRFASPERRNEVAAAIAPAMRPWIKLELLTEDELLSRPGPATQKTDRGTAGENKMESFTIVSSERSVLWKKLKQYVRNQGRFSAEEDQQVDRLAADVLAGGSKALQHAWALRHLSDRYTPAEIMHLTHPGRELLQRMLLDHTKALDLKLSYLYEKISPLLGDSADPSMRWAAVEPESQGVIAETSPIRHLFAAVEKLYGHLAATLAGGQLRTEITAADRIKPEQIVLDLKAASDAARTTETDLSRASDFSSSPVAEKRR